MVSIDKDPDVVHNITGAIIFVFYVLAALFLTSLIVSDLYLAYQSQSRLSSREGKTISNQLQVFVALAVLSFSTLSYHMLSYLILSYNEWASSRDLDQLRWLTNPSTSISLVGVDFAVRLWQFLTQSTLFHDFAETICKNGANFWWTQQALLSSIASALFISIEGTRRQVPHLWAYLAIGQILPISFAQSLFFITMLLIPVPNPSRTAQVPGTLVQCLPLAAYYLSVFSAPFSVGKPFFVSVIVVLRLLLLCPFVFRFSVFDQLASTSTSAQKIHSGYAASYKLALFCSLVLVVQQTALAVKDNGIDQIKKAVNSNPAVSAVGYDFVLYAGVFAAWLTYNPHIVDVSP